MRQVQLLQTIKTRDVSDLVDLVFPQVQFNEGFHAGNIFNDFDLIIR